VCSGSSVNSKIEAELVNMKDEISFTKLLQHKGEIKENSFRLLYSCKKFEHIQLFSVIPQESRSKQGHVAREHASCFAHDVQTTEQPEQVYRQKQFVNGMDPNFLTCSCARHLLYAYPVAHRFFQRDTVLLIQVAPDLS
jgi:hypothetical protein